MPMFHTGLDVPTPSPLKHGQPTSPGEFVCADSKHLSRAQVHYVGVNT